MVVLILTIISFLSCICSSGLNIYASTFDTYFARVMYDEVYLYKTPVDISTYDNVLFTLPKTYFVELLEDSTTDFFKVNYLSHTGYVKKAEVQTIKETPVTPYLTGVSFRVYNDLSRDLRSEPTTINGTDSQIAYIPLLCRDLIFIGTIEGETKVEGRTNIWYYCKYTADNEYYGYVYSDYCDEFELSDIPANTEEVTYIAYPDFSSEETAETSLDIASKTTAIVIAILCVPALIFIYLVLKSSKILTRTDGKEKEVKDFKI